MASEGTWIRLTGVKDAQAVDSFFASSLVDVAYVQTVSGDTVEVTVDESINLSNADDRQWIKELLVRSLAECGEPQARVEVVTED
jgi:hypothetical protein